jgi:hypothetical protein
MDPLQHDCFCEGIQQELTLEGVFPKVALVLGAGLEGRLCVAQAPVVDGFELSEVANQYDGSVPESEVVRVQARLAEASSFALLHAEMHTREKSIANERDLVDDQEYALGPRLL